MCLGWEDGLREMGTLGTGKWVEGDGGVLGMGGWVEGDGDTWDGRMGRGRWWRLKLEDG